MTTSRDPVHWPISQFQLSVLDKSNEQSDNKESDDDKSASSKMDIEKIIADLDKTRPTLLYSEAATNATEALGLIGYGSMPPRNRVYSVGGGSSVK